MTVPLTIRLPRPRFEEVMKGKASYPLTITHRAKKWRVQYSFEQFRSFRDALCDILDNSGEEEEVVQLKELMGVIMFPNANGKSHDDARSQFEALQSFVVLLQECLIPMMDSSTSVLHMAHNELFRFLGIEETTIRKPSLSSLKLYHHGFPLANVKALKMDRPRSMTCPPRITPSLPPIFEKEA